MEYKFKKSIRSEKGQRISDLGISTYKNDLDYCVIDDFIQFKRAQLPDAPADAADAVFKLPKRAYQLAVRRKHLIRLLDAIYAIQRTPTSDQKAFRQCVADFMPYEVDLNRDIFSPDFLKELWFTGEFLEQLLASDADIFVLDEWVDEDDDEFDDIF